MIKVVLRSLIYPWFILFVGFSIGFICNSEWFGCKYVLVERSVRNIFFPIKYDERVEEWVKSNGRLRLWANLECPEYFEVIHEFVKGEEHYWAVYKTRDSKGKEIKDIGSVRVKWKTWEYYYKLDEIIDKDGSRKLD
jgi:hypothetical protein